eukprot:3491969-Rhodomonas_salina.1
MVPQDQAVRTTRAGSRGARYLSTAALEQGGRRAAELTSSLSAMCTASDHLAILPPHAPASARRSGQGTRGERQGEREREIEIKKEGS